jgi:hypothetical protein
MDEKGYIRSLAEAANMEASAKEKLVEIPDNELDRLRLSSVKDRLEWYFNQRRQRRLDEMKKP